MSSHVGTRVFRTCCVPVVLVSVTFTMFTGCQFFTFFWSFIMSHRIMTELQRLLPNANALVAVSKGMQTLKLCTSKILQFLTGGAG